MTGKLINALLFFFYLCFITGMAGAFRAVSSISIAGILITFFIYNKTTTGSYFNKNLYNKYLAGCTLFFIMQIVGLLYANNTDAAWKHIQVKSGLLFIPLCFFCCNYLNKFVVAKLMKAYVAILVVILTWCLITAFIKFQFHGATPAVFFYHQLVSSLGQHAVQFSIIVFAALIYLLHSARHGEFVFNRVIHVSIVVYFIGGILLLSSKLVITFLIICLLFYLYGAIRKTSGTRLSIAITTIIGVLFASAVFFTQNPVSSRFNDIMHGNISIVQQASFSPENYFNGVQFRLLQWRFVKEILQQNNAWFMGVSPADAQTILDQKYIAMNMFIGEPGSNDHGFLGYNTHNQLLESLLQSGVIGLLCFIFICAEMIKMAVRQQNRMLWTIVILLIAYSFNESVLETQYGLVIFTFLPLFFYFGTKDPSGTRTKTY